MKVLHLNPGNLYGGIETMLVTLARYRSTCPEMDPCFGVCFEGRLAEEIRSESATLQFFPAARVSRPWTVLQARRQFRRILLQAPPDAVVTHGSWPHAIFGPVVKALGIPLVQWVHGMPLKSTWLERWAGRTQPDLMIANSQFIQRLALPIFGNPKNGVVHCPVALLTQTQEEKELLRRQCRQAQGLSDESTVVILQVSRIEPLKGHEGHLKALAQLKDLPDWQVWFAGGTQAQDEQYERGLRDLAVQLGIAGRVHFLGQRRDIAALLAGADIYCQPNLSPDGFGISFIEALQAGLPAISTAIGGPAEIITEDCGRLVEAENIDQLSQTLRELIGSAALRTSLGNNGPQRARELCDPPVQLQKLYRLIEQAVQN